MAIKLGIGVAHQRFVRQAQDDFIAGKQVPGARKQVVERQGHIHHRATNRASAWHGADFSKAGGRLGAGLNHDSVADPGFIQISAPGHQASFLDANLVLCRFRPRFFEAEKLGAYKGWRETPVAPEGSWFVDFSAREGGIRAKIVGVYTYICHWVLIHCVDVHP